MDGKFVTFSVSGSLQPCLWFNFDVSPCVLKVIEWVITYLQEITEIFSVIEVNTAKKAKDSVTSPNLSRLSSSTHESMGYGFTKMESQWNCLSNGVFKFPMASFKRELWDLEAKLWKILWFAQTPCTFIWWKSNLNLESFYPSKPLTQHACPVSVWTHCWWWWRR